MTELKIISNPFEKSTRFEARENKGEPWTRLHADSDSLGQRVSGKIDPGYFLENLAEICEAIKANHQDGEEAVHLYFEGPKNEYELLKKHLELHRDRNADSDCIVLEPLTKELITANELLNLICDQLVHFSKETQEQVARGNYDKELNAMTAALDEQLSIGKNASSIEQAIWMSYPSTVKARNAMLDMLHQLLEDIELAGTQISARRNDYSSEHAKRINAFDALRHQIEEKLKAAASAIQEEDLVEYGKYMADQSDFDHEYYSVESLTKVFEGFIDLAKMEQELKERQKFMEQFKWEAPKNDNTYETRQVKFKQLDREFQQKVQEAYKKANEIAYPYGQDYDYDSFNLSAQHDDDGNPGAIMTLEERTELFEKVFNEYTNDLLRESERKYEEIMFSNQENGFEAGSAAEADVMNQTDEAMSSLEKGTDEDTDDENSPVCAKDELIQSAVRNLEKSINEELPEWTQRTLLSQSNASALFWYAHAQSAANRIFDQIGDLNDSDENLADDLRLYMLQYLRKTPFAGKDIQPPLPKNMKIALHLESTDDEQIKEMLHKLSSDIEAQIRHTLDEYSQTLQTRHASECGAWIDAFVNSVIRYLGSISPELEDRENDIEEANQQLSKCESAQRHIQSALNTFEKALAWKTL